MRRAPCMGRMSQMNSHSNQSGPGHSHAHGHAHARLSPRALGWAMAATLALVIAEIFGGTLGRSVALLNDAVHNLSDVPTLAISWVALRWASRPADSDRTYGYHRAGILAAFTNALLLVFVALILAYEAWERFAHPVIVVESWMIATSIAALTDRKSTRLNSSHGYISYAVFCLKKKKKKNNSDILNMRAQAATVNSSY